MSFTFWDATQAEFHFFWLSPRKDRTVVMATNCSSTFALDSSTSNNQNLQLTMYPIRCRPKNLPHLAAELWTNIFSFVRHKDLPNVALCSARFHTLSLPFLYEDIEITNQDSDPDNSINDGVPAKPLPLTRTFHECTKGLNLFLFARSMHENPELQRLVKSLHFNTTGGRDNALLYTLSKIFQSKQIHLALRCRLDLFSTGTPFNLTSLETHCGRTGHTSPVQDGRLASLLRSQPTLKRLYLTCNCYCPHFRRTHCNIDQPLYLEHLSVTDIGHHRVLFEEILRNCVGLRSLYYCSEALPSIIVYQDLEELPNLLLKHANTLETLYLWGFTRFGAYGLPTFLHRVEGMELLRRLSSLKRLSVPANYLIFLPHLTGDFAESSSLRRQILAVLPPNLQELHLQILLNNEYYHQKVTGDLVDCLRAVMENKVAQRTPHVDKVVLWTTAIRRRTQRIIQPYKDTRETKQLRRSYLEQGIKLSFWNGDTGPLFTAPDLQRLQAESFGYSGLSYTRAKHDWAVQSINTPYYAWNKVMPRPQPRVSWDDIDNNPEYYRSLIADQYNPTIAFVDSKTEGNSGLWRSTT